MAKKQKKVASGKAIQWTPEQLDELATVTPADIEAGRALWRTHASTRFQALLDALPDDVTDGLISTGLA